MRSSNDTAIFKIDNQHRSVVKKKNLKTKVDMSKMANFQCEKNKCNQ